MKTQLSVLTIAVVLALSGCVRAQNSSPATIKKDANGRMVTETRLNGEGPFAFVVDTGAGMSCISKPLADKLGLPPVPLVKVNVQGTAGEEKASMYVARSYKTGMFERSMEPLVQLPNASIISEGVIGMNAFKSSMIVFDFAANTVTSRDSGSTIAGAASLPAELQGTDAAVEVEIDGVKAKAIIDTGSIRTFGNLALLRALKLETAKLTAAEPVQGATNDKLATQQAKCGSLTIGGVQLDQPTLVFADLKNFERRGFRDIPTIQLGIEQLSRLKILAIDFPKSEVKVKR